MDRNETDAEVITTIEATIKFLLYGEGDLDALIARLQAVRQKHSSGMRVVPMIDGKRLRSIDDKTTFFTG